VLVAENEREVQRLRESPDVRSLENSVIGTPEQVATTLRAAVPSALRALRWSARYHRPLMVWWPAAEVPRCGGCRCDQDTARG